MKFCAKFEVVLQKQILSVAANHSKSDLYSNDHRGKLDSKWLIFYLQIVQRVTHRITCHYSGELQTAKQILTTSKNSIEFTHSDVPCHLKVNRDKLALISRLWKCENDEILMITTNSFTKIVDSSSTRRIPPAVAVWMRKFRPLQEPIRLQDLFNSARSRTQKKINLHYRIRINKQRDTSFEFSSIFSTVNLSKHLITAWIIWKFIQLVDFATNNNVNYVFLFLLRQSSMVNPLWASAFVKCN